jgi:hypothetical protein
VPHDIPEQRRFVDASAMKSAGSILATVARASTGRALYVEPYIEITKPTKSTATSAHGRTMTPPARDHTR